METPRRFGGRPAIRLGVGLLALGSWVAGQAAAPVVSNVRASQRAGTGLVDIYYDVADADGDPLYVTVEVALNAGIAYTPGTGSTFSGPGYGRDITPSDDRHIIWDAGADLAPLLYRHVKVKVIADDGFGHVPGEMVYVPAGIFDMGETSTARAAPANCRCMRFMCRVLHGQVRGHQRTVGPSASLGHPEWV